MVFPYALDARVTHWPYATVGLIAVNVLAFVALTATGELQEGSPWVLAYGDGLHPEQWIGSMLAHGDPIHLAGNMLFLWVVGLGVEGKVGAARFLALYFSLGMTQSAIEQAAMLGWSEGGGSIGASSAIYAVLAIAAIWTPWNEVRFGTFWWLHFFDLFSLPMIAVAGLYVGLDLMLTAWTWGSPSSSLLHVSGAALGAPVAIGMLLTGRVDGEGEDLLKHLGFRDRAREKREAERVAAAQQRRQEQSEKESALRNRAHEQIRDFLRQGNGPAAYKLWRKLEDDKQPVPLSVEERTALVGGLHKAGMWAESAPLMAELIELAPGQADSLRVRLAQICVAALDRPGRAIELLAQSDVTRAPDKLRELAPKILARARKMQAEGCVELDDAGW